MEQEFKDKIEKRLALIGMKKSYLAKQIGISTSQLSQTFSGVRKLQTIEEARLRKVLNL